MLCWPNHTEGALGVTSLLSKLILMDPSVLIDIVQPAARVLLVVQRFPATDLLASGLYAEYVCSQARNVRRIEALC